MTISVTPPPPLLVEPINGSARPNLSRDDDLIEAVAGVPIADALNTLATTFYLTRVNAVAATMRWRQFTERLLDVVVATLLLLVTLPLLCVITLAVRLTSKGPAIYRQIRVGRYGSLFRCYKLRTMVIDADARLAALLATRPDLREEFAATYKLRHDPRTTRLGRFLRRTSLDELPQLFNVVRGQMSLVGPRPLVPSETSRYGDALGLVLSVRPGLTGVWQVSGRNDVSYSERVAMDAKYALEHRPLDNLMTMARTVKVILRTKENGAY
jgi:lipopolysaccharide/colanic/teichoic acid biosynthesis glycosyltransferase